jgi:hypothetical protein
MRYLLLFLLPLSLFASKILSYNIYDRTDRADIMITFDTPYSGVIKQSRTKSKIIIKLEDATIEAPKSKNVGSKFLNSLTITPLQEETQIVAKVPSSVKLLASKTADGYGLRLRFVTKNAIQKHKKLQSKHQSTLNLSNLPTKKENSMTQSYIIVIIILLLGIFILFYLKKKAIPTVIKQKEKQKTGWLFNTNNTSMQQKAENQQNSNEVSIRFQKAIDQNNSVVMLDFGKESYLVLMGNSNILLDKFHENKPTSQQEFESILQNRHEELENFLNGKEIHHTKAVKQQDKEPLQAYKERAASIIYNDDL